MIISPCISICKTDPQTGYCYGCARNNEETKKPNTTGKNFAGPSIEKTKELSKLFVVFDT